MSYSVALNFEDGVTRFIVCNEDESVLDAAYRHQINLPMDCSDGVCGTCKGSCTEGSYDLGDEYLEEALTEDEKAKGIVLACQMKPESDCVIDIPAVSSMCKTGAQSIQGNVSQVRQLSDSSIELSLELEEGLAFLPGQYANLEVPSSDGQVRAYSFTTLPGDKNVGFLVRNVPGGLMSSWLTGSAQSGDTLEVTGPQGVFYLRTVERPVLMLAGGTGLAPFLSMLAMLQREGCAYPVHLIYGVTHDADLVCLEQLEAFAEAIPNFTFKAVVASEESEYPRKGYVTDHMDDAPLEDGNLDIYLCGPPPMVDAVAAWLDEQDIQPNSFHYERFTPGASK